jgi:hypothetical protein
MKDLKVGEVVLTVDAAGTLSYQPVYFFGHRKTEGFHAFVRVATQDHVLLLTGDHFLPMCKAGADCLHVEAFEVAPARTVARGDSVLVVGSNGAAAPAAVMSTSMASAQGLFNPYTLNGRIVVDGVAASAHSSSALDPLFHALGISIPAGYQAAFAPLRLLYRMLGAGFMRWAHPVIDYAAAFANRERPVTADVGVATLAGVKRACLN